MPRPRKIIDDAADSAGALRSVLFDIMTSDGEPLFASTSELARAIHRLGKFGTNEGATIVYIGLVLRNERSCSDKTRSALTEIANQRISALPKEEQEALRSQLTAAIDEMGRKRDIKVMASTGLPKDFTEVSRKARRRFFISPIVAEMRHSQQGKDRINVLISRLGLGGTAALTNPRYTMCFRSEKDAVALWRALFRGIMDVDAVSAVLPEEVHASVEKLRRVDEVESLLVFVIPLYLCLTSVALFDIEDASSNAGFVIMNNGDTFEAYRMPRGQLIQWEEFCHEFERGKIPDCRQITFDACVTQLVAELPVDISVPQPLTVSVHTLAQ